MAKKKVYNYKGAAGGWGALTSTSKHLLKSENAIKNIRSLLKTNQHKGFDCPGCAWGDQKSKNAVKFCENGAKAVNWEATSRKADPAFFARHSVSFLDKQSDYFLEYQGRLTEPMRYNQATDHFEPISWEAAFTLIANKLNALESPNQAEFYTSGRTSNEAAFLYQLFIRSYGSDNFPDCSNMCHEASGIALNQSIGIGKGTVTLDDFEQADAIFVFGQNPGTNHPRMLDALRHASKNGAKVISFNNLKERGLERFTHPQQPIEMLTNGSTKISSHFYRPRLGGDMALVRGIVKALIHLDRQSLASKQESIFDHQFIEQHTTGIDSYIKQVELSPWKSLEQQSGISQSQMIDIAEVYASSDRVICSWAMGLTQHKHSVITLQEIINLLLLRGNIGKPGAGACPVRGHSNVQGDRTMGIDEKAPEALLDKMELAFQRTFSRSRGHNAIQAVEAMANGQSKVFFGMGGNFAAAMPDTEKTRQAMRNCELLVNVSTKLNRSHITLAQESLILPCLGRTEVDLTEYGEQRITVEDSMSMVHSSGGVLPPVSEHLKSEVAIAAELAQATLGHHPVKWRELAKNYDHIRDLIEKSVPGFEGFNQKLEQRGGFQLYNSAAERNWNTNTGKANIVSNELPRSLIEEKIAAKISDQPVFSLQTMRSHDQYNTTVYGYDDRYRGIKGLRNVIFMNPKDIQVLGLVNEQTVTITSHWIDGSTRQISNFIAVPYDIPQGNMAAYYPEANPLVPLDSYGDRSFTPTSKSIAITIKPYQEKQSA